MSFIFKFKFDCKSCGRTSKAKLKVKSKFLLEQELGETIELVCSKCQEKQFVRIKSLNAVIEPIWMIFLVTLFLVADYLLVVFLYENYWRPDVLQFNKSITLLSFGIILPIVLLIFVLKRVGNFKDQLNRHNSQAFLSRSTKK